MRDLALQAAGALAIVVALTHGALAELHVHVVGVDLIFARLLLHPGHELRHDVHEVAAVTEVMVKHRPEHEAPAHVVQRLLRTVGVNTVLAMTNIGWRQYLFGSFIGMLPMTLVQADIGASGNAALKNGQWVLASLMLALGLAASFLLKRAGRKSVGKGSQPPSGKLD